MIDQIVNNPRPNHPIRIVFAGDLVLDVENADHWLSGIAPVLQQADLAIGHVEVPHTHHKEELEGDVPAPGAPPENLEAIARAGIGVATLAGNHIADCGAKGIADTIEGLSRLGVASTGAGRDIDQARQPAVVDVAGVQLAVLSYNCIGPENGWAGNDNAGCAFLPVETVGGEPVAPVSKISAASPEARTILTDDIAKARNNGAQLVIVALHKGVVHTPAVIAPYERELARMAIDAGCDIVIAHHAHIIRGVELHKGKPIFHGLGNGCVVTHALSPGQDHAARAAWVERRKELFGFEPDPAYELAPFHPEAVNAMIGVVEVKVDGDIGFGFVPVFVEAPGRPVIAQGAQRQSVCDYVAQIGDQAGLPHLNYRMRDDIVEFLP